MLFLEICFGFTAVCIGLMALAVAVMVFKAIKEDS